MSDKLAVVVPDDWGEATKFLRSHPQYIFRGQADASWVLSTKIERICWQNQFPTNFLDNRESVILREFQRRAHHFISSPPSLDNKLEWYALLQHFGGPTRLLDFTRSFYVAAFFAMETATTDAAIWLLNEEHLYQHTDNVIREHETIYDLHSRSRQVVEKNLSHSHSLRCVMAVEPERLNERISLQQGLFVIPGDITASFLENLAATLEVSPHELEEMGTEKPCSVRDIDSDNLDMLLIKLVLPLEMQNAALLDLGNMNINAATLFPGLEGFARSLNGYLRDVV